ncbi:MAG: hypothetical protein BYD32DRAFT_407309 [Podila humilis]|nr:MAG: hypothetical protein BYD32DRAFT_407309 [Podila humilis]
MVHAMWCFSFSCLSCLVLYEDEDRKRQKITPLRSVLGVTSFFLSTPTFFYSSSTRHDSTLIQSSQWHDRKSALFVKPSGFASLLSIFQCS